LHHHYVKIHEWSKPRFADLPEKHLDHDDPTARSHRFPAEFGSEFLVALADFYRILAEIRNYLGVTPAIRLK
jgi:hypothetical protein